MNAIEDGDGSYKNASQYWYRQYCSLSSEVIRNREDLNWDCPVEKLTMALANVFTYDNAIPNSPHKIRIRH